MARRSRSKSRSRPQKQPSPKKHRSKSPAGPRTKELANKEKGKKEQTVVRKSNAPEHRPPTSFWESALSLTFCFVGLQTCYLGHGWFQELMMRAFSYGGERFGDIDGRFRELQPQIKSPNLSGAATFTKLPNALMCMVISSTLLVWYCIAVHRYT